MSELTRCNFCSLREYKRAAKLVGQIVRVKRINSDTLVPYHVFMYPMHMDFDALNSKEQEQYKVSMFGGLTDHCVC